MFSQYKDDISLDRSKKHEFLQEGQQHFVPKRRPARLQSLVVTLNLIGFIHFINISFQLALQVGCAKTNLDATNDNLVSRNRGADLKIHECIILCQ